MNLLRAGQRDSEWVRLFASDAPRRRINGENDGANLIPDESVDSWRAGILVVHHELGRYPTAVDVPSDHVALRVYLGDWSLVVPVDPPTVLNLRTLLGQPSPAPCSLALREPRPAE